jgi:hypothetical protein
MRIIRNVRIVAVSACVLATGLVGLANGVQLGHMPANKILFLGNSITFCPQPASTDWWGLSASTLDKDYAHLLTQRINTTAGGALAIVPPNPSQGSPEDPSTGGETRWEYGDPLPTYNGNIINICDLFELSFNTWENGRIQNQINAQPDIVVLQFGENLDLQHGTLPQLGTAMDQMLTGLKISSDPHIFVTGYILGANSAVDNVKRQLCAQDPSHRVFVDLSAVGRDALNMGAYGHPNDKGMALISDTIFGAMATHAAPEPGCVVLLATALVAASGCLWRKRMRST